MNDVYFYGGTNTYRVKVLKKAEFFAALNNMSNISEHDFREFLSNCEKSEMIKIKTPKSTLVYLGNFVIR